METFEWILSLKLFEFSWSILVKELVYAEEATAYSDVDFVLIDTNVNFLGPKLINAFTLSHEHDF